MPYTIVYTIVIAELFAIITGVSSRIEQPADLWQAFKDSVVVVNTSVLLLCSDVGAELGDDAWGAHHCRLLDGVVPDHNELEG